MEKEIKFKEKRQIIRKDMTEKQARSNHAKDRMEKCER